MKPLVVRTSRAPKTARLVSRGDAVEQGVYSLHSSFAAALNFLDADKLVSLVSLSVGPGPANIVLSGPLPSGEGPLEISPDGLRCDGRAFFFSRVPVYRSSLDGNLPRPKLARRNLGFLLGWLPFHAPEGSLGFLVGGNSRPGRGAFDRDSTARPGSG
ncbi:MAG: hypothetical protein HZB91_09660 [Elusimicrobia bacterium]|nr:hypothetical protein [Elusimicrobiota bacterium]